MGVKQPGAKTGAPAINPQNPTSRIPGGTGVVRGAKGTISQLGRWLARQTNWRRWKENKMRNLVMGTAVAALLAVSGAAFAQTPVRDITVEADLSMIQNHEAAATWSGLAEDLEDAVASRLSDRIGEEGAFITIKIDTLELANSFDAAFDLAESNLSGAVRISNEEPFLNDRYELSVSVGAARAYFPADAKVEMLTIGSEVFYTAMVEAFAENVAQNVAERLD